MPAVKRALSNPEPVIRPEQGGRSGARDQLRALLSSAGVAEIETLELTQGLDLKGAIMHHRNAGTDAVVAAGGDGTVSAVASTLIDTDSPLGVLPTGTLNHFAGDLGIPADLELAAHFIAAGHSIRVDVGKVNSRTFINNSSIGIYPAIVRVRSELMRRGLSKRIAMVGAVGAAVWGFPNTSVRVIAGGTGLVTRTPFVFVGNNRYEISGLNATSRKDLQEGVLQVWTVSNPSRFALFRALALAVVGNKEAVPELHLGSAEKVRVETLRKRTLVALDGEVALMQSPLLYSICPRALRVLVQEK
jgi:diacylglycerol kinase family enzyme